MVVVASIRHIGENLYSGIFRSILHPGGMKHTSNQKVVTAAIQKHSSKALFAPYPACTALPDEIPSMPLQSKIRACGVSLFTDFKSGNYRRGLSSNFRVGGESPPPFAHFKRGKLGLCPGSGVAALPCKVTFQIEPLKDEIRCLAALPCLCNVW